MLIAESLHQPSGFQTIINKTSTESVMDARSKGLNPFLQKRFKGKEIFLRDVTDPAEIELFMDGMQREVDSFTEKGTYSVINQAERDLMIRKGEAIYLPSRWVCSEKIRNGKRTIKARRVLLGHKDSREKKVSSPTPGQGAIKSFIYHGLGKPQMITADFITAFLNTRVEDTEVKVITDALDDLGQPKSGCFWLLISTIYGLRDAPREWWKCLTQRMKSKGFTRLIEEPCIFKKDDTHALVYVDDLIMTGGNQTIQVIRDLDF